MFAASTLLALTLKTSLLIAVSGIVCCALARKSAAYRHILWSFALFLSLLMPFAIHWLPSYVQIPVPWHAALSAPAAIESVFAASMQTDVESLWSLILVLWPAGAAMLLLRQVLAHIGLRRWTRNSRALHSPRWRATLQRIASEPGIERTLRVLESSFITSPCTWGFLRPTLLLPSAGNSWPEAQRRHALLHELAHVRRLDYASDLVARIACAVHWYNPAVWFAAAQMRRLQERACDDAVLRGGGTPIDYAQFLLDVAAQSNQRGPLRLAMNMARRSLLHGRVVAILDSSRARRQPSAAIVLAALISLVSVALLLATAVTVTRSEAQTRDPVAADVTDPTDPTDPTDETDETDVADVADVAGVPSVADVPDVPDAPEAHDATDGPAKPATPAMPAVPAAPAVPAVPAVPATRPKPAEPATTGPADSSPSRQSSAL